MFCSLYAFPFLTHNYIIGCPILNLFLDFLFPRGCPVCLCLTSGSSSVQLLKINLLVPEITANAIFPKPSEQCLVQQPFTPMTHPHPHSSIGQQRERECFVMIQFSLVLFVFIPGTLLNKEVASDILSLFPVMTTVPCSHPTFTISPTTTQHLPGMHYSFCQKKNSAISTLSYVNKNNIRLVFPLQLCLHK